MSKRRRIVLALGAGAFTLPCATLAQGFPSAVPHVAYLSQGSPAERGAFLGAFRDGLCHLEQRFVLHLHVRDKLNGWNRVNVRAKRLLTAMDTITNHVKLCNVQRARPRDASNAAAVDQTTIDAYMQEATTDDYNRLLQKTLRYVVAE